MKQEYFSQPKIIWTRHAGL